jgi:hypothetical protein
LIGQHWREADILNIGHYYEHVQNSSWFSFQHS